MESRKGPQNPPGASHKTAREQRLAAELRANLKRRKAAARSRTGNDQAAADENSEVAPNSAPDGGPEPKNGA